MFEGEVAFWEAPWASVCYCFSTGAEPPVLTDLEAGPNTLSYPE